MGTVCFHSVISCLCLLWDPGAGTYCWPNVTWRSLLSTAASGACHPLETLQTSITTQMKFQFLLNFLLFLLEADISLQLQGHQNSEFRGLQQGHWRLRLMSEPRPAMSPVLRVYHIWVIFTSFPITVSITVKPAKLRFASKLQCVFYSTGFRFFIIYSELDIA